eukprot:gene10085-2507_t
MLPKWVLLWFLITIFACAYDSAFLILRPRSLEGGDLFKYFSFYTSHYGVADPKYLDMTSGFVFGQCIMNIAEITLALLSFLLHMIGSYKHSLLLGLISSVMTWSKTVLYFLMDYFDATLGGQKTFHMIEPIHYFIYYYLCLAGPWIVIPFIATVVIYFRLADHLSFDKKKKE